MKIINFSKFEKYQFFEKYRFLKIIKFKINIIRTQLILFNKVHPQVLHWLMVYFFHRYQEVV